MLIVPVVSQLPEWKVQGPSSVIFYDPDLVDAESLADVDAQLVPCLAGSAPVFIPGEPQPTEEHFEETLLLNPALAGWGDPLEPA